MGKNPAMQLYVNDWLSSPRIMCMSPLEELAYFRLLLFCWASGDCSVTSDLEQLGRLSRTDSNTCSTVVQQAFNEHPTKVGFLTNERLYFLWLERQEFAKQRKEAGIKSAEARSKKRSNKRSTRVEQALNSSSSSSSSSFKDKARAFVAPTLDELRTFCTENGIEIDTEKFFDHYQSVGWRVGRSQMRDWKSAVRQWARREPEFASRSPANGTRRPVLHSADVAKELAKDWRP